MGFRWFAKDAAVREGVTGYVHQPCRMAASKRWWKGMRRR